MPIEIKQITIKAEIGENLPMETAASNQVSGVNAMANVDEIVQLAVEKVMEILKDQQER
ncbi:MAG: hypothetical protein H6581_25010 [Bacteroidia bacterium]|nr:hypothetical protein [Bacteroidia bacterium]